MAPRIAPYVQQRKSKSGKVLALLSYFTVFIWPVFNYIGQLFEWDKADPIDTEQDDKSSLIFYTGDEYVEENSNVPISATNSHQNSLEDLKNQFQNKVQQFGKDLQDKVEAEIEGISEKLNQVLGKKLEQLIVKELNRSFYSRHEFKKPTTEEDCHDADFKKEGKEDKKAVENFFKEEKDEFKHKENKLESKNDSNQGPKMLQCSGGNGNNAPSKNQPTVKGSKQSNQTTANPSDGYANNDGGFGGDGNDPPKRNPELPKGHYRESAVPLKKKDEMPEGSSKLQPETLVVPLPYPESSGSSNESKTNSNENRSTAEDENGSSEMQVDRSLSLGLDTMSLSDDKNENSESSDNKNGNGVGLVDGNGVGLVDGNGVGLVNGNGVGLVNGNGPRAMDGNWSSAVPVNIVDMPSDSENEQYGDSDDDNDGNLGHSDSETVLEQRYPDSIPTFHRSNETQPLRSRYKILHQFQAGLSVGIHGGLYRLNRDFIILGEIDRGRFGVCFEILDIRSGKKFALKKIVCKDFDPNELKIWSVLSSHRNVVTLLGAYDDEKHVNIFMEFMDGTLKYIADNRKALNIDERRVAALMKQVLKCLAFMHDEGYVHADIKPDNILIGHNDIKVGDFGLTVDRRETTSNIGVRGTVPYMPKELFCGGEYRASVDIYEAAGVMRYLLTGSPPWAGYVRDTIIFKVGSGEIPEIPYNCSGEIKKLLKRMLHPDSQKRPTAKELLQDPIFSDTPESVLDKELVEVLVDTQLLRNGGNLAFAPMTLDGEDGDEEPDTAHPL